MTRGLKLIFAALLLAILVSESVAGKADLEYDDDYYYYNDDKDRDSGWCTWSTVRFSAQGFVLIYDGAWYKGYLQRKET